MEMKNQKKALAAFLLAAAFVLGGCGEKEEAPADSPSPQAEATAQPQAQGPVAERVGEIMGAYENELALVNQTSPSVLTYLIPGEMLNQMAQDAQAAGARLQDGRWRFSWQQSGDYVYESTAWDAMDEWAMDGAEATADPADEAPMDSQLNGDYAVSGGGAFDRVRAWDAAEDLSFGSAEFSDTLNGQTTGHEVFRFCLRGQELYFADATLDLAADMDGLTIQEGYLATVGVLRPTGLDVVEYRLASLNDLPDPATLNLNALLSSVTPLSHISAQKDKTQAVRENEKDVF